VVNWLAEKRLQGFCPPSNNAAKSFEKGFLNRELTLLILKLRRN
jgi:hypothetical protein